jgi:hypothetical protein
LLLSLFMELSVGATSPTFTGQLSELVVAVPGIRSYDLLATPRDRNSEEFFQNMIQLGGGLAG